MVIGHGGHATTMAALAHDLPVLVMPMHPMLDQKMVGQSLVDAGAGRLLSKHAKPAVIAAVVGQLVGEGPHRAAAARLGATIRRTSGARRRGRSCRVGRRAPRRRLSAERATDPRPRTAHSSVARGWRGSYIPTSPPPGRRKRVSRPQRSSEMPWVNSTPRARSSCIVVSTSSHMK